MPSWLDGASFWPLFAFFFAIVFFRTQATYWIARVVTTWSLDHTRPQRPWVRRVHAWLQGEQGQRGVRTIERWGLIAVPLSFLASGTKTVINGAAGVLAMPFARYLPAMLLGCVAHSIIYATIGWAAWLAALSAATGSPWGIAALVLIVLALGALIVHAVVRARRRRLTADTADHDDTLDPRDVRTRTDAGRDDVAAPRPPA
ncbi:DedA family protein [Serinibacter salmoneus]|uniref:Membrane protein DedA with SNARE-associated domain n=1 Tax=Serinibacter salmoneus TaxID=556530 RepID=A0A2A9D048_9MICO|nr:VTT domain-containing protein [Serinibacter salmoneus]PFG20013.1 membrane protein DedA with SNARE-associated domain [Serinibacter salmoneus]